MGSMTHIPCREDSAWEPGDPTAWLIKCKAHIPFCILRSLHFCSYGLISNGPQYLISCELFGTFPPKE